MTLFCTVFYSLQTALHVSSWNIFKIDSRCTGDEHKKKYFTVPIPQSREIKPRIAIAKAALNNDQTFFLRSCDHAS
jgi:hypothetical protein